MTERSELIVHYAQLGHSVGEITLYLNRAHNIPISARHVRRLTKQLKVNTRRPESDLMVIESAIREELRQSGSLLGYRSLHKRLKLKHHLSVRRDTVMALLALIDPKGSSLRRKKRLQRRIYRNKGPNYAWHCDGYDKLKPFGLAIHECIDGYFRRIMWLNVAHSNNNPRIIAHYFLDCVGEVKGCPQLLRTDLGTENSVIAVMQPMLRHDGLDEYSGLNSHRYGTSTLNQRIEALWNQLRRYKMEWWIAFFKDLEAEGHFNSALSYHVDAVRFCFGNLISRELEEFMVTWNHHRIRQSNMAETPGGVPDILYYMPQISGGEQFICPVDSRATSFLRQNYCTKPTLVSANFEECAMFILSEMNHCVPSNLEEACSGYFCITKYIELNS